MMSIHVKSRANAVITNFTTKLKQNGRWLTFLFERIIDSLSTKLLLHEISKLQRNNNIHKQKKLNNDIRNSVGLFNVVFFETGYRTKWHFTCRGSLRIPFLEQTANLRNEFTFDDTAGIKLGKFFPMKCVGWSTNFRNFCLLNCIFLKNLFNTFHQKI